ncbi:MAG TPA: ABC transporter ATP-binding protein [Terriglobales bacterium]|nr:ABC transporter ATP-binding protein [Terriglobales bacterium]
MSVTAVAAASRPALALSGVGARTGDRWILRAVDLSVSRGEMVAVVGPSGAGKSTLARLALGLSPAAEGTVRVEGQAWDHLSPSDQRRLRPAIGYVQQDPQRALDPAMTVAAVVCEGLELQGVSGTPLGWGRRRQEWRKRQASPWLERVGLDAGLADRYPHELSGGQRQRVAIARAMITQPRLLVADEPSAALDAGTGVQVMGLLEGLQRERNLAVLLVTHQLAQAAAYAQRLAVLAAEDGSGRIVEIGPTAQLLQAPQHAITRALVAAIPPWPAQVRTEI